MLCEDSPAKEVSVCKKSFVHVDNTGEHLDVHLHLIYGGHIPAQVGRWDQWADSSSPVFF